MKRHLEVEYFRDQLQYEDDEDWFDQCSYVEQRNYANIYKRSKCFEPQPLLFRVLEQEKNIPCNLFSKMLEYSQRENEKYKSWVVHWLQILDIVHKKDDVAIAPEKRRQFLQSTSRLLDEHFVGAQKEVQAAIKNLVKNRDSPSRPVLGLYGPKGNGKTMTVRNVIGPALNRPVYVIPLAGEKNASKLKGHQLTYEGSQMGLIAQALVSTNCKNPILLFDEVDKADQELQRILVHICDPENNDEFKDEYLEFPLDISGCTIILTYNDPEGVNHILRDRFKQVRMDNFSTAQKHSILRDSIVPKLMAEKQLEFDTIAFDESGYRAVIDECAGDEGLRSIKQMADFLIDCKDNQLIDDEQSHTAVIDRDFVLAQRSRPAQCGAALSMYM